MHSDSEAEINDYVLKQSRGLAMITGLKVYYLHSDKITTNVFLKGCGAVDDIMLSFDDLSITIKRTRK